MRKSRQGFRRITLRGVSTVFLNRYQAEHRHGIVAVERAAKPIAGKHVCLNSFVARSIFQEGPWLA